MLQKSNWVCTICGQGFTRRSSGKRHNGNLHDGMAKLVRPFDYITGRLNGQISPPAHDPWAYRRYKRKDSNYNTLDNHKLQINRNFIKQNYLRWNSSTQAASAVVHEGNLPKQEQRQRYQDTNDHIHSTSHAPRTSDRMSKLEELKMLLSKHCRPNDAKKMLTVVIGQLVIDRNEDFLDATLAQLRDRDRLTSSNYNWG